MTAEETRLEEARAGTNLWRRWGPYVSERQWGTVREDYTADGSAWEYFTHDQARSRAYRWGEDGIARVSPDAQQQLCFALALWNGADPIPKACKGGKPSKLHVAFHGCLQGGENEKRPGHSGNLFSKYAGYNEWAKANDVIVLYPQVRVWNSGPINPQGCWDWWGQDYTHEGYHTKRGRQIKAVAQMINILAGGEKLLDVPPERR